MAKFWRLAGGVALCVGMIGGAAAPAVADTSARVEQSEHCAVEVSPLGEAAGSEMVCFGSQNDVSDYLSYITGSLSARGLLATTILGVAYTDANGGGSSFTFWGSSGCVGVVFGFSSLASGWDNSISSAGGSNGCWLTLYSATGYGGSRLNCTPWCGSVYGLNDAVKSIVFRPTGTFG